MVSPQSVIGPQSVAGLQSVTGPPCPASTVVIPAVTDGRFFRSVEISTNPALQTAVRGFTGFLSDQMLQITERVQADALRATTIQFMCEHVDGYIGVEYVA